MRFFIKIALFLFITINAIAKNYSVDSLHIQATVLPNGNLNVSERISYHFKDGVFSWAEYSLSHKINQQVLNLSLSENNHAYKANNSEESGSFTVEKGAETTHIKWFYSAEDTTRHFTLSYTLSNVVTVYRDVAVFDYHFMNGRHPKAIKMVKIKLLLPQLAQFGAVQAWVNKPYWAKTGYKEGHVQFWITDLPEETAVHSTTLFPVEWIPNPQSRIDSMAHGRFMALQNDMRLENNLLLRQAQKRAELEIENNAYALAYGLSLSGIPIILFAILYMLYGRAHPVRYDKKYDYNVPKQFHPSLLSAIYHSKQVGAQTLSTTLIYLAQNKYITINNSAENGVTYQLNTKIDVKGLLDFEQELLRFLFKELSSDSQTLTHNDLESKKELIQKWFPSWAKLVNKHLKNISYYERKSIIATTVSAIVSAVMFITGLLLTLFLGNNALILMFTGLVFSFVSLSILRYTDGVKGLRRQMQAVRSFLTHLDTIPEVNKLNKSNWQDLILFSFVLNLEETQMKAFNPFLNKINAEFSWFNSTSPMDITLFNSALIFATVMPGFSASTTTTTGATVGGGIGGAG